MRPTEFCILIVICYINVKFVFSDCEKSYMIKCADLADVKYNTTKSSWRELLIEYPRYEELEPRYELNIEHLNKDLSNLKWLIVVGQLTALNKNAFMHCKNLQLLMLHGNKIRVLLKYTFKNFKKLIKLGLDNNGIEHLEDQAFLKSTIEEVDLSYNKLQTLGSGIFTQCQVLRLVVTHNRLFRFESNSLPGTLKILNMDYNKIRTIPNDLKKLHRLKEFTLSHNDVTVIFDFNSLELLETVDFSFNKIETVDNKLNNLTHLKHLDLSHNNLKTFTFTPDFKKNIAERDFVLLLAYNRLRNLNLGLVEGTYMTITLSGNPWNCKCATKIENKLIDVHTTISRTICDKRIYFSGKIPYCFVSDTEKCTEDEITDQDYQTFRDSCKRQLPCNVFTEIETYSY